MVRRNMPTRPKRPLALAHLKVSHNRPAATRMNAIATASYIVNYPAVGATIGSTTSGCDGWEADTRDSIKPPLVAAAVSFDAGEA